jgi:hypothetical protein
MDGSGVVVVVFMVPGIDGVVAEVGADSDPLEDILAL